MSSAWRHFLRPAILVALSLILLTGCLSGAGAALPTASETTAPAPSATVTASPLPTATETPGATTTPSLTPRPPVVRVLIVSMDGLRPEAIQLAPMSNLLALMESGAYTLTAQTVFPSATLPAHASMLTGQCPAKHGVTWNDYLPAFGYAAGSDLFDLAKAAGLRTVMVVGKEKLRQVTEPESTDVFIFINDRDTVIAGEVAPLIPQGFGLMLVHFPAVDWMGHEYGWLSPEQLSVAFRADEALGTLLAALEASDMRSDTLIIVAADHGGHETSHGSSRPEDMTIPWVIHGPGVRPLALTEPVNIADTAATAAWALGLPIPPEWDGRPVTAAFGVAEAVRPPLVCP